MLFYKIISTLGSQEKARKIIVYTHAGHALFNLNNQTVIPYIQNKNQSYFWNESITKGPTAGALLREIIGNNNVYIFGTTAARGQVSYMSCGNTSVKNIFATSGMLEDQLLQANFSAGAIIDLSSKSTLPSWLRSYVSTFAVYEYTNLTAKLPYTQDGLLFYPKEHLCTAFHE